MADLYIGHVLSWWYVCSPADIICVSVKQQEAAEWCQLFVHLRHSSSCCHWLLMETH